VAKGIDGLENTGDLPTKRWQIVDSVLTVHFVSFSYTGHSNPETPGID